MYSYLQTPNVNQKRGREWSVGIIFTQVIDTFKIEIQMDFAFQSPITFPDQLFWNLQKNLFREDFFPIIHSTLNSAKIQIDSDIKQKIFFSRCSNVGKSPNQQIIAQR